MMWINKIPFKLYFFLWRLWNKRIPIGEVLVNTRVYEEISWICCEENVQETIEHLLVKSTLTNRLWCRFAATSRIACPFFATQRFNFQEV